MRDAGCWMLDASGLILDFRGKILDAGWSLSEEGGMSYRTLEVWSLARDLVTDIHQMTLHKLPRFEAFEEGSQIWRSMKSVKATIVEGYGRRRYKQDFLRFLVYSLASCDETTDHLETTYETGSLSQRSTTASGVEGAGLGLSIVREVAEKHGGSVSVEANSEKGVTFRCSISKDL